MGLKHRTVSISNYSIHKKSLNQMMDHFMSLFDCNNTSSWCSNHRASCVSYSPFQYKTQEELVLSSMCSEKAVTKDNIHWPVISVCSDEGAQASEIVEGAGRVVGRGGKVRREESILHSDSPDETMGLKGRTEEEKDEQIRLEEAQPPMGRGGTPEEHEETAHTTPEGDLHNMNRNGDIDENRQANTLWMVDGVEQERHEEQGNVPNNQIGADHALNNAIILNPTAWYYQTSTPTRWFFNTIRKYSKHYDDAVERENNEEKQKIVKEILALMDEKGFRLFHYMKNNDVIVPYGNSSRQRIHMISQQLITPASRYRMMPNTHDDDMGVEEE